MIRYILRLSIAAFIIILAYDTINFYMTSLKVPREKQLVVVQPAVKQVEKSFVHEPFDYDFKESPYWYGGLGAAAATGLGLFCYCLTAVGSKTKMSKAYLNIAKGEKNFDIGEPEGGISLNKTDVPSRSSSSICQKSNSKKNHDNDLSSQQIGELTVKKVAYEAQDKVAIESEEEILKENNLTPSVSRPVVRQETRGSLLEKHIKLELSNGIPEHPADEFKLRDSPENDNVFLDTRMIIDEEVSYSKHSTTNDMALITLPEQVIAAMSYLQSSRNVEPFEPSALTKDDLLNIESRLETIERRIHQIEDVSKECKRRLEMTETEMVELQEQMYTVLTKLEEEQKPNYIIVSQMSAVEEAKEDSTQDLEMIQIDPRMPESHHEQDHIVKERISREMDNSEHLKLNDQGDCQIPKEFLDRPVSSGSGKIKSIGLEAMLERDVPRKSSTAPPKKANPKVPTHFVPPYKRSSFTATDSLSDIKKVSRRLMKGRNERFR